MTTALPDPLTPADCDLQGFEFMPLYGHKLLNSEFMRRASDLEFRLAVTLWWTAWNQVPASSAPDDDHALQLMCGMSGSHVARQWRKSKEVVLHGFVKCSDGRLYHKVLSKFANEAWERRKAERDRKRKYRDKLIGKDGDKTGTETGTPPPGGRGRPPVEERRGEDSKKESSITETVPPQPDAPSDAELLARSAALTAERAEQIMAALDNPPNLLNLGRVGAWMRQGATFELILSTLRAVAARQTDRDPSWTPSTLTYFDRPIADAIYQLTAPMPAGKASGRPNGSAPPHRRISVAEKIAWRKKFPAMTTDELIAKAAAEGLLWITND